MSRTRSPSGRSWTPWRPATRCCAGRSVATRAARAGRSSASSPASRTCPTSSPTPRYPRRWPPEQSPTSSLARWQAASHPPSCQPPPPRTVQSAGNDAGSGVSDVLEDAFGRIATDQRVSLTDRCNLRCSYCMPAEGLDWLPGPAILTDDEVGRLVAVAVQRLGVTEVRFTGGEPLLRRGLAGIVARTAVLSPRPGMSLTT